MAVAKAPRKMKQPKTTTPISKVDRSILWDLKLFLSDNPPESANTLYPSNLRSISFFLVLIALKILIYSKNFQISLYDLIYL